MATDPIRLEQPEELMLTVPPEPQYVSVARLFAAAIARGLACDEEWVEDLKIAISEACTNAIKAHHGASVAEPVRIVARRDLETLWFEIIDAGGGFDPEPVAGDAYTPVAGIYEGSLGLVLIRSLFRDAVIVSNDRGGTTVRFSVPIVPAS